VRLLHRLSLPRRSKALDQKRILVFEFHVTNVQPYRVWYKQIEPLHEALKQTDCTNLRRSYRQDLFGVEHDLDSYLYCS
jgi:hypothetical protein